MTTTQPVKSFEDIHSGDTLIVTPNHGSRFAVRIDTITGPVASGRQARLANTSILSGSARKIIIPGDFRRNTIEREVRR